jgi:AcrR family transcriptional regulator
MVHPTIDRAITEATMTLLRERGFARMSMEAVASAASVGKPAIYRRFRDKAELVATAIAGQLPQLDAPDLGDTRAALWTAVERGFPADPPGYVGLIGGLIAEQERHPSSSRPSATDGICARPRVRPCRSSKARLST